MEAKGEGGNRVSFRGSQQPAKNTDWSSNTKSGQAMGHQGKRPWYKRRQVYQYLQGLTISVLVVFILTTTYCAYQIFQNDGKFSVKLAQNKISINIEQLDQAIEPRCTVTEDTDKFECHPELEASEDKCLARGCCWSPAPPAKIVGVPSCFYPPEYSGYKVNSVRETKAGILVILKRITPSGLPKDIQEVQVKVMFMDEDRIRIKISDPNAVRYEVPFPKLRPSYKGRQEGLKHKFDVVIDENGSMGITRKETDTKIFDANLATMIFADQLLQLNIKTPNEGYYGIGESKDVLLRGVGWRRYILFNRDNYPTEELNMYGTHPFYLQMEKDSGNAHGVFLFNSNSMEVITQPTPGITFRTIGGILDFYIFMGPSPSKVIQQYTDLIGRPFMPPYWSLGFHLCRYGYGSVEATRAAWKRTIDAKIPFDTQWNDIDYMENYNDFTVDPGPFRDLKSLVDDIHKANMRYVMITDVGIGGPELAGKYPPYDDGVEMDCLVKNITGDVIVGKVWNKGSTVYPDFTHPRAGEYLTKQYRHLYDLAQYDGSWIDMNEPANFVNGSLVGCPEDSSLENPPYIPGNLEPLHTRTLCMTSQHHASTHYNVHNIHSLTQAMATNIALRNVLKRRPFIISRSTFAGFGAFAGHWNGDISSTWDNYRWSIPSILTFGMFGVPMMGADICGFKWNTTVELCARWQALGAFYPFSRNHNDFDTFEQDPVIMGPIVEQAARNSLMVRYHLLPFLYTLFYRSHVYGETVARPIFFEFPQDRNTYAMDNSFLWGPALMILPVMNEGETKVRTYVPKDVWYDFFTELEILESGKVLESDSPIGSIHLLVRGGYIIPTQVPATNTVLSRKNKFGLLILLKNGRAEGELYWDDGDSLETYQKGLYNLITFAVAQGKLKSVLVNLGDKRENMVLGSIKFLGAEPVSKMEMNGKPLEFAYNRFKKVLKVTGLSQSLLKPFTLQWT